MMGTISSTRKHSFVGHNRSSTYAIPAVAWSRNCARRGCDARWFLLGWRATEVRDDPEQVDRGGHNCGVVKPYEANARGGRNGSAPI